MKIVAGIVTYNPSMDWLKSNINSLLISPLLESIFIIDNASTNVDEIETISALYSRIVLIKNKNNEGIAVALNQLCNTALNENADWIITMDQDSIISENYIEEFQKYSSIQDIGIVTCRIEDIHFGRMYSQKDSGWEYILNCITSGCMTNLQAWKDVGGFDENLFIDGVDFDFCLALKVHGFKIIRSYDVWLKHEVGHGRRIKFLGHNLLVLNHSSLRLYYIARNYLYLGKKYNEYFKWIIEVLKRIFIILFYEKDAIQKIKSMFKGISDFHKNKMGRCDYTF